MRLYRVFPFLASADAGAPGHPRYIPRPQGGGRIDQPTLYEVLYLSDAAAGAVAETFGDLSVWTATMFSAPTLKGAVRALGEYELDPTAKVFDLDDARALVELGIRPSDVVTRDRAVSRSWARRVFLKRRWSGVRWWSYYDPRWHSYGIWDIARIADAKTAPLSLEHPAVVEAATVLRRPLGAST